MDKKVIKEAYSNELTELNIVNLVDSDSDSDITDNVYENEQKIQVKQLGTSDVNREDTKITVQPTEHPQNSIENHVQRKRRLKMICAKAYLYKGYGSNKFKAYINQNHIKISLFKVNYQAVAYNLMTDVVRKIERVLTCDLKQEFLPLDIVVLKDILPSMLRSDMEFTQRQNQIIRGFVEVTVGIGQMQATKNQIIGLYSEIKSKVQAKLNKKKLDTSRKYCEEEAYGEDDETKPNFSENRKIHMNHEEHCEHLWTHKLEQELVQQYLKGSTYLRLVNHFRKFQRGVHSELANAYCLKSRIHKIIRMNLSKLETFAEENKGKLPILLSLTSEDTKILLSSPNAAMLRLILVKFYRQTSWNLNNTKAAIEEISVVLKEKYQQSANNNVELFKKCIFTKKA